MRSGDLEERKKLRQLKVLQIYNGKNIIETLDRNLMYRNSPMMSSRITKS
jgi:hypothetical protein